MHSVEGTFTTCININAPDHRSSCHIFLVCWWRKLAKNQRSLPAFFLGPKAHVHDPVHVLLVGLNHMHGPMQNFLICFGAPKLYAFPICKCYEFLNILLGYPLCLTTTDNITTKHVCKAFLQEYKIRDIRFRVLWSKQDPNAKGEDEHERNRKKTGPQRRRETRPRQKYEKITRKKWEKKWDLLEPALKNKKNGKSRKIPRVLCVFFFCVCFAFVLFFSAFSFCVFFVFFGVLFVFFGVFLVLFLLFFSPLPRGCCFCARRPWRRKSLM